MFDFLKYDLSDAARDLQLVQMRHSDNRGSETPRSTTSRTSSRSRRRQSPHPNQHERTSYNRENSHHRQKNAYDESTLQHSIYRKFEETETLLDQLRIQEGFAAGHPQVFSSVLKKTFCKSKALNWNND